MALLPGVSMASAEQHAIAACPDDELQGYEPSWEERDAHRQMALPIVAYREGERPADSWGFSASLRVDESGAVRCYALRNSTGSVVEMNPRRRAWLQHLGALKYLPFREHGNPVVAVVRESVREAERPRRHHATPNVPLAQVTLKLERTPSFGPWPGYSVEVRGDGQVTYFGRASVDVEGEHRYVIPRERVESLVLSLRQKHLWSAKSTYGAPTSFGASNRLTLQLGDETHVIEDYEGFAAGIPEDVTAFAAEIDAATQTSDWIVLSEHTIHRLTQEHFDFTSAQAGLLAWRAVNHRGTNNEQAIRQLLQHGAPPPSTSDSFIEAALRNRRTVLADTLIAAGALLTDGHADRSKIERAFRAAVFAGRLAGVEQVWAASGSENRPSLMMDDVDLFHRERTKRVPVVLMLSGFSDPHGEGQEIAAWFAAKGCDLKAVGADGRTLLHIAAGQNNPAFTRYLLDQGLSASTEGPFGLPPIASTSSEAVALQLLAATSDTSRDASYREIAVHMQWPQVIARLDARRN